MKDRSNQGPIRQTGECGPALKHIDRQRSRNSFHVLQKLRRQCVQLHSQTASVDRVQPVLESRSASQNRSTEGALVSCLNLVGGHRPPLQLRPLHEAESHLNFSIALPPRLPHLQKILFSRWERPSLVCQSRNGTHRKQLGDVLKSRRQRRWFHRYRDDPIDG